MRPVFMAGSHTNNLPTPTDLNENLYTYEKKKTFLLWSESKFGLRCCIQNCLTTTQADFLKFSLIFEIKGGADSQILKIGLYIYADPYIRLVLEGTIKAEVQQQSD
jgi:hypothetical protein